MPASDDRTTVTVLVEVLSDVSMSRPPVLMGSASTVAVLVSVPPAGKLVMRTGIVMAALPVPLS